MLSRDSYNTLNVTYSKFQLQSQCSQVTIVISSLSVTKQNSASI